MLAVAVVFRFSRVSDSRKILIFKRYIVHLVINYEDIAITTARRQ